MSDYNLINQFTPEAFAEAMANANRAKKLRFNHGDENNNLERPETKPTKKRGRPKKRKPEA